MTAVMAYLLGSVPFGMVMARLLRAGRSAKDRVGQHRRDQRAAHRQQGRRRLTLVLDAGKGGDRGAAGARGAGRGCAAEIAGFAAFLGHCYPVFLRFRGGKGVATFLGTLLALAWPVGLAACATWACGGRPVTRISSLSALVAAALSPIWALLLGRSEAVALLVLLAVLIFVQPRGRTSGACFGRDRAADREEARRLKRSAGLAGVFA